MFIAALFIIARTWKKPKCPTTEKLIKKKRLELFPCLKVLYVYVDCRGH